MVKETRQAGETQLVSPGERLHDRPPARIKQVCALPGKTQLGVPPMLSPVTAAAPSLIQLREQPGGHCA